MSYDYQFGGVQKKMKMGQFRFLKLIPMGSEAENDATVAFMMGLKRSEAEHDACLIDLTAKAANGFVQI